MGLFDFLGGGSAPKAPTAGELANQTYDVQKQYLPRLQQLRGQHDAGLSALDIAQTQRTQQGLSGINQAIAGDISRDRRSLNEADMAQFREQNQGFAGAERLQALLQAQSEQQLALGGRLSGEQERDVAQGSQAASFKRGRGVGNFSVAQLGLNRFGAQQDILDKRRGRAFQTIQSGQNLSNPFRGIQQGNIGATGSILDRLRNSQDFGRQGQVNFDPISGQVAQNAQNNFAQESQNFQSGQAFGGDIFGGLIGGLGGIAGKGGFGNPFGIPGLGKV